jgi:hypothetical protein
LREYAATQIDEKVLTNPIRQNLVTKGDDAAEECQGDIDQSDLREEAEVSRHEHLIQIAAVSSAGPSATKRRRRGSQRRYGRASGQKRRTISRHGTVGAAPPIVSSSSNWANQR